MHKLIRLMFALAILIVCGAVTESRAAGFTASAAMVTARAYHTSTLLPNGKVLIVGGYGGSGYLASAELYDPATGSWTSAGNMTTARDNHTATLLPNGKVLVAGGNGSSGYSAGAELYDPVTFTWVPVDDMTTARGYHTATLLPNGTVLVAGGINGSSSYLASAELYDTATGHWTPAADMKTAVTAHTATLLPSGMVLIAGGNNGGAVTSAQQYDPSGNSWMFSVSMGTARDSHTATLLPGGLVLVAGGSNASGFLSGAELFNPVLNSWTPTVGALGTARKYHSATLLPNGTVLVTGGNGSSGVLSSTEIYTPASGNWTTAGTLAAARNGQTATLLANGTVLISGGTSGSGYLSSVERYDPATGSWTATGGLNAARHNHTATLLPNGKVLVAGGYNNSGGFLSSAELYDPATGSWTATGGLNAARHNHTATLLPNGKVLVSGGYSGDFLSSAELYDPATGSWTATGSLATGRTYHTATLLPNGNVLVAGGYNGLGSYLSSAELYDPATGSWTATGGLNAVRYNHTATLLPNGKVLVSGGGGYDDGYLSSTELYDPATGSWTATGSLGTGRSSHTATLLPNGKVLVTGGFNSSSSFLSSAELYDPATGSWTATGRLNAAREAHTATLLPNGKVLVTGGFNSSSSSLYSAELYDPATSSWTATGGLNAARHNHTATLLPNGKVLVSGGYYNSGGSLSNAELYDPGLGYLDTWRAVVGTSPATLQSGETLTLTGSGFRGFGNTEASGGTTNSSATDYPLVQLSSVDGGLVQWLSPASFSATAYTSQPVINFPAGPTRLTLFVNGIPSLAATLTITHIPTTTSVTRTAGVNPSTYGESLTFRATVTSGATGVVLFREGATTFCSAPISSGLASCSIPALSSGAHTITASYEGDLNYAPSSGTVSQTVNMAASTTAVSLTAGANPSSYGQALTFTATLSGGATGTVIFNDGATTLCSATVSNSQALCVTSSLGIGMHTISAAYSGDVNYTASQGSLEQTVNKLQTTTQVSSDVNPSKYGLPVTFTATVTSGATGTVLFTEGAMTWCSSPLSGTHAVCVIPALSYGSHTISAAYGGDVNSDPSGGSMVQVVKYAVSYDGNGSSGGSAPTDSSLYLSGAAVTVAGAGTLVRTGYVLGGWNTAANGSGSAYGAGATFNIAGNITLYAVWLPKLYVTYDGTSYYGGSVPVDSAFYLSGATVTVLGNSGSLIRIGYLFSGWNTAANGSGTHYNAGATFAISSDTTLYATWTATTMPTGLVSWYRGDETNALDSAGGINGTASATVLYAAGKVGQAFSLNGSNAYVSVPNNASHRFGANQFSLVAWIKTSVASGTGRIITKRASGASTWYSLVNSNGKAYFESGASNILSSITIADGSWHHIAVTRDPVGTVPRKYHLYIDGAENGSAADGGASLDSSGPFEIGRWFEQGQYFNGLIDEVQLFNRALTAAEVLGIYNDGSAGLPVPPTISSITPASGSASGGTAVAISGNNLTGVTAVRFGSTPATGFTFDSDNQITAISPSGVIGAVADITVTTPGGVSATGIADRFTYVTPPLPVVSAITPSSGSAFGGTLVTITGTDLTGATAVKFNSSAATGVTVDSATQLRAVSPASVVGLIADITVTTPGGTSAISSADQFTYTQDQARNVTTGAYYASLATALANALIGAVIRVYDSQFDGAFVMTTGMALNGGYNAAFAAKSGTLTTLNGSLTVQGGASTAEDIIVKGKLSVKGGSLRVKGVKAQKL